MVWEKPRLFKAGLFSPISNLLKALVISGLFLGLLLAKSSAQIFVDNFDDFKDACQSAQPGDEIILAEGRYEARSITISNVQGTAENPVIIRAENIGKDTLHTGTYMDLRHCSHITFQGFVIEISEKYTTFKIQASNNIRITQNVLDGAGESYYKDDGVSRNSATWIILQGIWDDDEALSYNNRIDHNILKNKQTLGNMIRIDGTDETWVSQYDVIEYNHFKNMGPRAENEMEAIRIGWSEMSESDGYCTVSNNLFEDCNGDPEIISVKCNKNTLSHNTFLRCQGTLSLRHGDESLVEGNFFLGEEAEGTGGVRIYGSDHRIINNYFEGLAGTKWDAPITLTYGDEEEGGGSLSDHFRIERAIIANNTLVNNHHGIEVGFDNQGKYSLPPRDVVLAYNLLTSDTGTFVKYINPPDNMSWIDNLFFVTGDAGISEGITFTTDEVIEADPQLVRVDSLSQYKATTGTPWYTPSEAVAGSIDYDIDGQLRSAMTQYGADEYQAGAVVYYPLTHTDVGPEMGDYLQVASATLDFPVFADTADVAVYSSLDWEVSVDETWISADPVSGSGDGSIRIIVEANESGIVRTARLSIQSTNAEEEKISRTIAVSQADAEPPELSLDTESLSFAAAGGSQAVAVSSNTDWEASADAEWISIDPASGNGSADLLITVEENLSRAPRSGSILVTDNGSLEAGITVSQDGFVGSEVKLLIVDAVASTEQASEGNIADNVYDGNLDNRWSGEGDGAYIDLELEYESVVSFIKVGLFKGDERYTYFDIQTSLDGVTYFDALMDNTAGMTTEPLVIFDIADTSVNFIRIVGHGNSSSAWNSFTEFEVWGWEKESNGEGSAELLNIALKIYPNPSDGSFFLQSIPGSLVEIRDLSGRMLWSHEVKETVERLDTGLSAGSYYLSIKHGDRSIGRKMIIK